MAFVVSKNGVRDRDIKYIYSDQSIRFVYPKRRSFLPLKEERPLPPLKKYPRRFYEYYPRMNIGLPRAPAFRQAKQSEVDRIVNRICKPITCQRSRRKDILKEEDEEDVENEKEHDPDAAKGDGSETDRSSGSKGQMSRQELNELLARLEKSTESSRRKEYKVRKSEDEKRDAWKTRVPKLPPIQPIY